MAQRTDRYYFPYTGAVDLPNHECMIMGTSRGRRGRLISLHRMIGTYISPEQVECPCCMFYDSTPWRRGLVGANAKVAEKCSPLLLPTEYAVGHIEGLYTVFTSSGYHAPLDEVDDLALLTLDPDCSPRRPNRPSVHGPAD